MSDAETRLIVAVSRRSEALDGEAWQRWVRRCRRELTDLLGDGSSLDITQGDRSLVISHGLAERERGRTSDGRFKIHPLVPVMVDREGSVITPEGLQSLSNLDTVRSRLAGVNPPFGYVAEDASDGAVVAGTDSLGFRHMYVYQGASIAMASSSSSLLARIASLDVDEEACAVYSLLGCFLGSRTMFAGVDKLAAGEHVVLLDGIAKRSVDSQVVPKAVRSSGFFRSLDEAVEAGVAAMGESCGSSLAAHPGPLVELSGGLDSRMVLAIARQRGLEPIRTLTIGVEGSADQRVAAQIVADRNLRGAFVPFSRIEAWDVHESARRVTGAALRRDFSSNPLSGAIHEFVGSEVPAAAQLTGQGGELGRGSYFAGQRQQSGFDAAKVESLVRWRLAVNQAADRSLFRDGFAAMGSHTLRRESWRYFEGLEGDWPAVTDQIYLFGRMQRWAGAAYSQWRPGRSFLTPFFHPAYVDWASRLPIDLKRNSRAFVAVLDRLDPDLARRPLDSGLSPTQLTSRSGSARLRSLRRDVRRGTRKVGQRLLRRRHSPEGADRIATDVVAMWRDSPPTSLQTVGWLNDSFLDQVLTGEAVLDAVSVAFLVNLEGAMAQAALGRRVVEP